MINKDYQIIPAVLSTTEEDYKQKLEKISSSGLFVDGWVQIDIMDNKFVQNQSVGLDVISKYQTYLKKEAHLMVEEPQSWIDHLVKIGFQRIVFPFEVGDTEKHLQEIKSRGVLVGISLNPQTSIDKITPFLDRIDLVLLMSVDPGFSGQEFIPQTLEKIRRLTESRGENKFIIEVDGGINLENVKSVVEVGADNLVMGSHLTDGDISENLENIWERTAS